MEKLDAKLAWLLALHPLTALHVIVVEAPRKYAYQYSAKHRAGGRTVGAALFALGWFVSCVALSKLLPPVVTGVLACWVGGRTDCYMYSPTLATLVDYEESVMATAMGDDI